jgi:hypothetical protein
MNNLETLALKLDKNLKIKKKFGHFLYQNKKKSPTKTNK